MAEATVTTRIANPARKRKNVARKMSLKQKAAFGSKRVRAAAKLALARQRKRKRNAPKAKAHRPRTKPRKRNAGSGQARKTVMNPKRRNAAKGKTNVVFNGTRKKRRRKNGSAKAKAKKRKNTGALYALVNPARKKGKRMATKKNKTKRKRPAGSYKKKNKGGYQRKRNAGAMGRPADWLALGAGAVVGGLGATSLPQMVLAGSNTGPIGYLGMAAATAILAVAGHFLFKKNMMLTSGIIAGGAGALIKRVIGDYTPLGQYLNANAGASGMGDYLTNFNFTTPQIIGGPGNTQLGTAGTTPVSVAGVGSGAGRALMNV